jgi:omega-amidase
MKAALLQSDLYWENPTANRAMLEEKIWQIGEAVDIIVLPEMFSTGFSMNPAGLAEPVNGQTLRWMKQVAGQTGAAVCGSCITSEKGDYYNRLYWVEPEGDIRSYNKRHLFRMGGEDLRYRAGSGRLIVEWKGWRIMPLICYDLRFPVWSRNVLQPDGQPLYDLLIYVANWPSARTEVWDVLLRARAIENLSWVIGVNRTGTDGAGIAYAGGSAVINFKGQAVKTAGSEPQTLVAQLSLPELQDFRKKFPAHLDADAFRLD